MIRTFGGVDFWLTIISTGRPKAEDKMGAIVGPAAWYVRATDAYPVAADRIVAPDGVSRARNAALDDAFDRGLPCVQLSDDLSRVARLGPDGEAHRLAFRAAVRHTYDAMEFSPAKLGGAAPTSNPFFARDRVNTAAFIVGDFIVVKPSDQRFDEELRLKEDYDFTLAHLAAHGAVARLDWLLMSFAHRTNAGGAVDDRTADVEQQAIGRLRQKWGDAIRDNPRRPNEILLNVKALDGS